MMTERKGWKGWHDAGAKALALRPNSLWDASSSAPYNIVTQLVVISNLETMHY